MTYGSIVIHIFFLTFLVILGGYVVCSPLSNTPRLVGEGVDENTYLLYFQLELRDLNWMFVL